MVKLSVQKRLAGKIMKCSPKRVLFDKDKSTDIKESITKSDIRGLIKDKVITKKQKKGISCVRSKRNRVQKQKGKRRGSGSRKGTKNARDNSKRTWINQIRLLRDILKNLKDRNMLEKEVYRQLYEKAKGGYFRSKRHMKIYIDERNLLKKKE